jgi:hypothetical protein
LDQFAISEIFKIKSGIRHPGVSHQQFWEEVERDANKAYLLQQVVFPISSIHKDETIVSPFSSDLPKFRDVLENELKSHGVAKRGALRHASTIAARGSSDTLSIFEAMDCPILNEFRTLKSYFERSGMTSMNAEGTVFKFWDWPGNEQLPEHRIFSYLFAAIAHRIVSGQKRRPSRGMMNDFKAIATYGPYVDVLFLDNECAQLLSEGPLRNEVQFKAKIFSLKSGNEFLQYLRTLQSRASIEVRAYANDIYGLS